MSEIMTIIIYFHQSNYRNFKSYYLGLIKSYFTGLLSYPRFVTVMKRVLVPLYSLIHTFAEEKTGVYFIDSTLLRAYHIKREK